MKQHTEVTARDVVEQRVDRRALVVWRDLACVIGLALLPLLVFWQAATLRGVFFIHDIQYYFYPYHNVTASLLRQGQLPLWNPYSFSGMPLLGDGQTAMFYPPNWLFFLLPGAAALNYALILQFSIAGVGAFFVWPCAAPGPAGGAGCGAGLHVLRLPDGARCSPVDPERRGAGAVGVPRRRRRAAHPHGALVRTGGAGNCNPGGFGPSAGANLHRAGAGPVRPVAWCRALVPDRALAPVGVRTCCGLPGCICLAMRWLPSSLCRGSSLARFRRVLPGLRSNSCLATRWRPATGCCSCFPICTAHLVRGHSRQRR